MIATHMRVQAKLSMSSGFCYENPNQPGCNSCEEESLDPGCWDPYCTFRICSLVAPECCEDAWSENCVLLAGRFCQPAVIPIPSAYNECPGGFICDEDFQFMSNCTDIRNFPVATKIGDVYGGTLCPSGVKTFVNCPIGSYCPDSETQIPCPEGKFCSYKSFEPWIDCPQCREGAQKQVREIVGVIILCILMVIILIVILVIRRFRLKKEEKAQMQMMVSRMAVSLNFSKRRKQDKQELERLRPKLEIISKRLESRVSSSKKISLIGKDDRLTFDARQVFDAIDLDQNGSLEYSELNVILDFDRVELEHFFDNMQELGGVDTSETTVTRPIFCKHFLQALDNTLQLKVTPQEAAELYDEIIQANRAEVLKGRMIYTSSVSRFLSELQIFQLIKKFSVLQSPEAAAITKSVEITKKVFVENYPAFLYQILTYAGEGTQSGIGVDICFKNLSLAVKVAGTSMNVVDHVSGRIKVKTMTALMGGSGAGKTSLLNALCGRAYYGQVTGETIVNGTPMDIDDARHCIGFVPQDDIVYAELTVRENLIYAGKFQLPKGTSQGEIEELADETLANLGLSRVADSLVGDVRRRGVSGGEKKRVNIGLELMRKPACLFLDEPTSGLDASSALLVMSSLKHLVDVQGVTVVSVIHQPRKFIFDLFDSLILLGVGGKMVYHGHTNMAYQYFHDLQYHLPAGESIADWLIDISSGRLKPEGESIAATQAEESEDAVNWPTSHAESSRVLDNEVVGKKGVSSGKADDAFEEAKSRRVWLYSKWENFFDNMTDAMRENYEPGLAYPIPKKPTEQSFFVQLYNQIIRSLLVAWRNVNGFLIDTLILLVGAVIVTLTSGLPEMTKDRNPNIPFANVVNTTMDTAPDTFAELFQYAATVQWQYPLKLGVITAVLIGLQATKIVTTKRLEFFRESGSGYNGNAYFLAVNCVATCLHSFQMIIVAFFAAWLREPVASWGSYFAHFLAMAWICVSWALFVPMVVPPESVTVIVGFFMAFFGLLLSGALPPVNWETIYGGGGTGYLAGWLSPTRFFIEGLTVGEYRCLPEQSGWTVADTSINRNRTTTTLLRLPRFALAGNDPNAIQLSCNGWYWGILPSIFIGLTIRYVALLAMHSFFRGKQTKKSLPYEIRKSSKFAVKVALYFLVFIAMAFISSWLFTRTLTADYEEREGNEELLNMFLN